MIKKHFENFYGSFNLSSKNIMLNRLKLFKSKS